MKYRYYISDPFYGGMTGTNDEKTARYYASSDDYFVVDTETGVQLACSDSIDDLEVPEAKPSEL